MLRNLKFVNDERRSMRHSAELDDKGNPVMIKSKDKKSSNFAKGLKVKKEMGCSSKRSIRFALEC